MRMIFMDQRGQVAVEYLLTVLFAVLLVIAVTVIAFQVSTIADRALVKIIDNTEKTVSTLLS